MAPAKYLSALLVALSSFQFSAAIPVAGVTYPEVIPGPGLPSLTELGLTSEQLYTMTPNREARPLAKRAALFDPICGPNEAYASNVDDVVACYNYLNSLGTQACCTRPGEVATQMCYAGGAHVVGEGYFNPGVVCSYCQDVAYAVLWTLDHCTRPDRSIAGTQAAYGNGDLIVGAYNINW